VVPDGCGVPELDGGGEAHHEREHGQGEGMCRTGLRRARKAVV
jgi:hypothetical protein